MATDAERAAAAATWERAVGRPDPQALAWADGVLDRVESDQRADSSRGRDQGR